MRWFIVALALITGGPALALTDTQVSEVKACLKEVNDRLHSVREGTGGYFDGLRTQLGYNADWLSEMLEKGDTAYYSKEWEDCDGMIGYSDVLVQLGLEKIAEQKKPKPTRSLTDHEQEVQEARDYMKYLEDTRKKLAAQAERHEIDAQHNGFRLDYFYMADGTLDWCRTQIMSSGPIMKCSRWPE